MAERLPQRSLNDTGCLFDDVPNSITEDDEDVDERRHSRVLDDIVRAPEDGPNHGRYDGAPIMAKARKEDMVPMDKFDLSRGQE